MKKILIPILTLTLLVSSHAMQAQKRNKKKNMTKVETKIDSLSYALGVMIGENFRLQELNGLNLDVFNDAMNKSYNQEKTMMTQEEANILIQNHMNSMKNESGTKNLADGQAFLDENKTKEGVITTESGLQYKILKEGEGENPTVNNKVKVHYTGTLINGTVFDSSVERGEPIVFGVSQVIPGWTEGLQLMRPGSKYMFYIPSNLAYGERGAGETIGPNTTLIFEVDLLEIQ